MVKSKAKIKNNVFEPMLILLSKESYSNKTSLFKGCDIQESTSHEMFNMRKSESEFSRDILFGKDIIYTLNLRPKPNQTKHLTVVKNFKSNILSAILLIDFFGYVLQFNELKDIEAYGLFHGMISRLRIIDDTYHYNHNIDTAISEFEAMISNSYKSEIQCIAEMVKRIKPSSVEFESLIAFTYGKMLERLGPRI